VLLRVGLTGGVGSGKSTVSARLAAHGAVIIDADAIAREVVEPGTSGLAAVVERFGPDVLTPDGALDRQKLADVVFNDEQERLDLNGIVHPLVGARTAELMAAAPEDAVVVYDVPLLAEGGLASGFDVVVVVEAELDTRLRRLADRGMPEADARARIAAQAPDEQRRGIAHHVVDNSGPLDALYAQVDALWERLAARQGGLEATGGIQ
jgi:dephospho-CoA kinase